LSLLCCFSIQVQAQQVLKTLAEKYQLAEAHSPAQFNAAGKYAQALFFNNEQQEAIALLKKNIESANRLKDGKYSAYLYAILAMNSRLLDQVSDSEKYIQLAKNYSLRTNDFEIKGYVAYCEGWLWVRNAKENEGIKSFLQALTYLEKAPSSETLYARQSTVLKEISSIYANWKAYDLQEKYSKQLLSSALKHNEPNTIFEAYMSMGYLYEQQLEDKPQNIQIRDAAENYYKKAIQLFLTHQGSIATPSNLSYAAINLANLYLHHYPESYTSEIKHYAQLGIDQAVQLNDNSLIASGYGILSELALRNSQSAQAKDYLFSALLSISSNSVQDKQILMNIYARLSDIFESEQDYQQALSFYRKYIDAFESVYDSEKLEQGRRLEAQFDKERQQQKMLRMELQAEKKEQQIHLMEAFAIQQKQDLQNLKLTEENQRKELELVHLESEKHAQELRLSKLETQKRAQDILNYQTELKYKEKLNRNFTILTVVFILFIFLLLYAYSQRSKTMKQQEELHNLALEKEKQNSKISNLTSMLEGQEKERGRLARDLHDGLGGLLASTKINLSHRLEQLPQEVQQEISPSIAQIDIAVHELRRVAHNLMPDLLLNYGLQEALKDYAARMSNTQIEIDVEFIHYQEKITKEQQLLVYRIIQELVNNTIKHAQASQLIIQIIEDAKSLSVVVEDNGIGFDTEGTAKQKSAGLHNIASRIQFLKGNFRMHSQINLGTTVEFDFPKEKI